MVIVDGKEMMLDNKDALYIGRGAKEVTFGNAADGQALFYFNQKNSSQLCCGVIHSA